MPRLSKQDGKKFWRRSKRCSPKKQAELNAAIDEGQVALHDRMFNGLHTECLLESLHKLNFHDADNFNEKELNAFTAAVDFYGGIDDTRLFIKAITDAAKDIKRGDYAYFDLELNDYHTLGSAVFDNVIEARRLSLVDSSFERLARLEVRQFSFGQVDDFAGTRINSFSWSACLNFKGSKVYELNFPAACKLLLNNSKCVDNNISNYTFWEVVDIATVAIKSVLVMLNPPKRTKEDAAKLRVLWKINNIRRRQRISQENFSSHHLQFDINVRRATKLVEASDGNLSVVNVANAD